MASRSGHRWVIPIIAAGLAGPADAQQEPAKAAAETPAQAGAATAAAAEWTESDTRLANHYIRLLEQNPEYGNVLDLLWGLYEKRGQTALLVDYFKQASMQQGSIVVQTLFAHLLRKAERLDEARDIYSAILETAPDDFHALRGAAEISDQQKRSAKALALYNRLAEKTPIGTEDGAAFRLRQAAMLKETGQIDEAARIWNELIAAWPGNVALRSEIVALLIEAGRADDATAALKGLAQTSDPEARLNALNSLARLHEFVGDFEAASVALRDAMAVLHFQHHEYAALFERLVRLHERFDRLPELAGQLEKAASQPNPSEQAVHLMAEFHRLTADPAGEEEWAARLAALVPDNADYQLRLVDIRMRNDHYEAAAETLDRLIAAQAEAPLSLTLLRSRVALNLEGREAAEGILDEFLKKWPGLETAALQSVLSFAREHYLDGLVERLLAGDKGKMLAGGDSEAAPMELARFFRERGRSKQAEQTLRDYVAEAEGSSVLKAARLAEVTAAFRELDLLEAALTAIDEAIALAPENLEFRLRRAEIFIDQKRIDDALAVFEEVWEKSSDIKARTDIDQRMFSLLRGQTDENTTPAPQPGAAPAPLTGPIQTLEQYRAAAIAASSGNRAADDPPPRQLTAYFEKIKATAEKENTVATRYRAGWWAIKLQDNPEASHQLNSARAVAGEEPVVEVEKLLLSVAELYEQLPMMARQLETLTRIDPENAADYRQRRAEVRFSLGYEDEAVRELEEMAKSPDASLNTLKILASLYQKQGRADSQVAIWQEAYRRADLFEKRNIIKQLSNTLVELGRHEEALKAQMDLIRRETDPIQRRKEFDSQLSIANRHFLLTWMAQQYQEMAQQNPFEAFFPEALSRIHRAQGDYAAAFQAMKRAYYMAGQDREMLDELGELAGLTKDLKAAIYYRRQMIALNEGDASPETWQSLVEMLERDLRVGESDQIRERLESKFTQDADFLTQLSRRYQGSGRWSEAERVLARLTSLRPWDAASWLDYGLVLNELDRPDQALTAFEKAIEETREAALPAQGGNATSLWPYLTTAGNTKRRTGDPGSGNPNERVGSQAEMLRAISDYPHLDPDTQEVLVDWLEKSRPEFTRTPGKPREIRLRAIEEAALLHGRDAAGRAAWVKRWQEAADISPTERLWAFRYAGAGPETVAQMQKMLPGLERPLDRFLFSVVALQVGEAGALMAWSAAEPAGSQPGGVSRRVFPLLALLAILAESREGGIDPLLAANVEALVAEWRLTPEVGAFLFESIRDSGRDALALAVGRLLVDRAPDEYVALMLDLAQVAGRLGLDAERSEWLRRCVDTLQPRQFSGLPYYFHQAVSERFHDLESAAERESLLAGLSRRIESHPAVTDESRLEGRALLALVAGDGDAANRAIRELVARLLDRGRPSKKADQGESFPQMESWAQLERVLNALAARRPATVDAVALFRAMDPELVADPGNVEAVSQYEQFETERVCWLLESMTPAERERELSFLYARLRDAGSRLQLARTLEARGLHRESIPIYRLSLEESPDEISPARGFFSACLKSRDHRAALDVIAAYLSGERRQPAGMTPDYIYRQHAEFLLMAGDIETLTARAMGPGGPKPGHPPAGPVPVEALDQAVFYQSALVRAHERRGNDEAVLRVLTHLRNSGRITKEERLLAGRAALRRGDRAAAVEWLSGIALDQQQAIAEVEAIRQLASIHATATPPDRAAISDLARTAGAYGDLRLLRDLAGFLFQAGAVAEGRGVLLLAARDRLTEANDRVALLTDLVGHRLRAGDGPAAVAPDLLTLMENLPVDEPALRAWIDEVALQLPRQGDPATVGAWVDLLNPFASSPRTRLAAGAALWWLNGGEAGKAYEPAVWAAFSPAERDLAIELMPRFGDPGIAESRRWLTRRAGPASTLCEGEEIRQIRLFGQLGDRVRAAEVQARLLREARTDGFQQFMPRRRAVTAFNERWPLPVEFAKAGFADLAGALFDAYQGTIRRLTWEHNEFLQAHARYLIDQGDFQRAERLLAPAFQKSIGTEPDILFELYRAWGRLSEIPARTARLHLPPGLQVRLDELRQSAETGGAQ
ncbi:MAG: tetratricopeptide repeat protein [Verrucomicrobiales bacterium]|nr:tetratricopeptide repeat protein [Verrucomicrobiales bacterium]